jgi:leader peptidase (prepilin peptidase)/N-methyltransferase
VSGFVVVTLTLVGLLIGSHLTVVVSRVPEGRSVVAPRSACPRCGHTVRWFDNVPVVSWLVLRGRCRDCREPIAVLYPLLEAGTAVMWALVGWWGIVTGADPWAVAALLAVCSLGLALSVIDVRTQRLPDPLVVTAGLAVVVCLAGQVVTSRQWSAVLPAVGGAGAYAGFLFVLALIWPAGMGLGDVKLAAVLGGLLGWFGWASLLVGGFAPFVLGAAVTVPALAARSRLRRGVGVPFGPFMVAGALLGVLAGPQVVSAYLSATGLG